jgi:hypothetical protein
MSEQAMSVPEENEEYQFAELFIQLPEKWPLTKQAMKDPNYAWPLDWLRSIAQYPFENDTWLGAPATIIANGDPPERLAPKIKFTSLLLLAEHELRSRTGRKINLYRISPLYSEERELEMKKGIGALLQAFDRKDIPFVVDLKRPNAAIHEKKK